MPTYSSPHYAEPLREEFYFTTPTATPSPREGAPYFYATQTPQRPATRAGHARTASASHDFGYGTPPMGRPPSASPRYTSGGFYATAHVSSGHPRKYSSSGTPRPMHRERRNSAFERTSSPYGVSDDEQVFNDEGWTYFIYTTPKPERRSRECWEREERREKAYYKKRTGHRTDYHYAQTGPETGPQPSYYQQFRDSGAYDPRPPRGPPPSRGPPPAQTHARRASTSTPQRPQTARPSSSHRKPPVVPPPVDPTPVATEADAKRHRIPKGYQTKNWDPRETPILLLGSVFDANSLGKWIYDWTVYRHGGGTPMANIAGELWLLLIQLAGKVRRAEQIVGRVRDAEKRDLVEDFIAAGDRLGGKLVVLLKACEKPMLEAAGGKESLGKRSGVEFVETLFGRDRQLDNTEKFMAQLRLFNTRFDANLKKIIRSPAD